MLPPAALKYVLFALEGTPQVLASLLHNTPADSPLWDLRPDPERFTIREVLAHMADWEEIFHGRILRMVAEANPSLPDIDEGEMAIKNNYGEIDPLASLARMTIGRATLIATLRNLTPEQWQRVALREKLGSLNIEQQAVLILGHDGYHTHQVARYLKSGG